MLILAACSSSSTSDPTSSAAAGSAAAGGGEASGAASSASWDAVVESAKEEGSVTWYSVAPPAMNDAVAAAFSEKYPDIALNVVRGASELPTRMDAEIASNTDGADVFLYAGALWFLNNKDHLESVDALPSAADWPKDEYATGTSTPVIANVPLGIIAWNTSIFPNGFKTWDDLLAPEVKDKLGIRDQVDTVVASYVQFQQDTNGSDYLTKLAQQNPRFYPSVVPMAQAVAAGEIGVANQSVPATLYELQGQGAPIDFTIPDQTWVNPYIAAVLQKSERKNAANVFMNFLMSPEGQAAFNGNEYGSSALPNIAGTLNLSGKEVTYLDPTVTTQDKVAEWQAKYKEIFNH
jgi:iron(III) transport system substrate-binding protein